MKDIGRATDLYCSEMSRFGRENAGPTPTWLQQLRLAAGARFADLGFPTTHHEEWRHTDVTPIVATPFSTAKRGANITQAELEPVASWVEPSHLLVFVNGHFSPSLSLLKQLPQGVIAGSLRDSRVVSSSLLKAHLGRQAQYEDHAFIALNTAFLKDGAFLYLPGQMAVEEPILVLFVSCPDGQPTVSHTRVLVVAGPSSRATVIESYVGLKDGLYFTNAATEVVLGKEAVVDHYLLQQESRAAYYIATLAVHQGRNSTFTSHSLALGSALARSEVHAVLDDEGSTCTVRGLYALSGRQHVDTHTKIDHAKPGCTSQQFYKGVLGQHAAGVFSGRILVRQDAHKTDARQSNQNLLLSEDAVIHTTPQLEIFADDVRCVHGATVGQLDREALFYLRSRGIDLESARRLMTQAFGGELIRLIAHDRIRNRFTELFSQWISQTCRERLPA